eukprot:GHVU01193439.1.p1 GENE.GHVU01193439.1~~GHVU01193439.1.p1  ORF type:complete len:268 (+),score=41.09 GHVU01193439.1:164-967(+)
MTSRGRTNLAEGAAPSGYAFYDDNGREIHNFRKALNQGYADFPRPTTPPGSNRAVLFLGVIIVAVAVGARLLTEGVSTNIANNVFPWLRREPERHQDMYEPGALQSYLNGEFQFQISNKTSKLVTDELMAELTDRLEKMKTGIERSIARQMQADLEDIRRTLRLGFEGPDGAFAQISAIRAELSALREASHSAAAGRAAPAAAPRRRAAGSFGASSCLDEDASVNLASEELGAGVVVSLTTGQAHEENLWKMAVHRIATTFNRYSVG